MTLNNPASGSPFTQLLEPKDKRKFTLQLKALLFHHLVGLVPELLSSLPVVKNLVLCPF
jgi:hypothetical protein